MTLPKPLPPAPLHDSPSPPRPHSASQKLCVDGIPRRCRIDLLTPGELAIRDAVLAVEGMGADVRLTEAVVLLQEAREKVADYVELVDEQADHLARERRHERPST